MVEKYFRANRKLWDEFAKLHFQTENEEYNVKAFLQGETTLKPYELEEMGDVQGKTLLHLQCHFGLDTLSWAREGAIVTGIDFSGEAIKFAKFLTKEVDLKANFIQTNLYDLPDILSEQFDIIYTSIGVLCWLNDLKRWAEIIAHFLKPEGFFYIAESHPFSHVFDNEHKTELQLKYDYFHNPEPMEFIADGSYARDDVKIKPHIEYEWSHSLSEIINSLISAGLKIDFLHEYPFSPMNPYPFAEQGADGYYRLKNQKAEIPLFFTLKATKITR
ncbi:MAG: methyltransferase domain-containing protein [Candidatus Heimdallarchaeota archaeon]|nr:methyltransferase domain-containing protein [Candidatus Heimdallarchaeota archaeon]